MSKDSNPNRNTPPNALSAVFVTPLPFASTNLPHTNINTNEANEYDIQPLAYAVRNGDYNKAKALLQDGANPNASFHILSDAVGVEEGAATKTALQGVRASTPPLMVAAAMGNVEITNLLIDYGAQINAQDNLGYTPLMAAAVKGRIGVIQTLITKGAHKEVTNTLGETVLHLAIRYNHAEIACKFIFNHADINCVVRGEPFAGATPLIYLVMHTTLDQSSLNILHKLLEADADKEHKDNYGMTALAYAIKNGYKDIAKDLINAGTDLHWQGSRGEDYLLLAIQNERVDLVKILLDQGVHVGEGHVKLIEHYQTCNKPIFDDSFSYLEIPTGHEGAKPIDQIKQMVDAKLIKLENEDDSNLNYHTTTTTMAERSMLAGDFSENSEEA